LADAAAREAAKAGLAAKEAATIVIKDGEILKHPGSSHF